MLDSNLELALQPEKEQIRVFIIHSAETAHSDNGVMKESQMIYDHNFSWICATCLQPYHHTTDTLGDSLWWREEHTMWHALHQDHHPSWANCSPCPEDSTPQFWHSESRVIHVSDSDPHFVPNMLNGVHVRTPIWPLHPVEPDQQSCHVLY